MMHNIHRRTSAITILARNRILDAIARSSLETIWPLFLFQFFPSDVQVGYVAALLACISLAGLLSLYPLFHRFHARDIYYTSLTAQSILFMLYAVTTNKFLFLLMAAITVGFGSLRLQAFGILLRENSTKNNITQNEGYMYFIANIGWAVGPLLAGVLGQLLGIRVVIVFSSVFLLLAVYNTVFSGTLKEKQQHAKPEPILKNMKSFFKKKERRLSYILGAGLEGWYALPYIFIPLSISQQGLGVQTVGIFLFCFGLPLIAVQYYIKKRKFKLRNLFMIGYGIMAAVTIATMFTENIYAHMILFIIGGFGSGLLEPITESYFFSITTLKEERSYYGVYNTSYIVGAFLGQSLIATLLISLVLTQAYIIIGILMIGFALVARKVKL